MIDVKIAQDLSQELSIVEHQSWYQFWSFQGQEIQQNESKVCRFNA